MNRFDTWLDIYHHIIRGYDSIIPLTPEERTAVPYVVISIQLICVAWFSEQENEPELFEINKKITRLLVDSFQRLKSTNDYGGSKPPPYRKDQTAHLTGWAVLSFIL